MNKNVKIITTFAVVLGLFTQIVPLFNFIPYSWVIKTFNIIKLITPTLNLSFIFQDIWIYHNHFAGLQVNFLDLSVYIVGLVGLISYIKSDGKEIRLLRFLFSILILIKTLLILNAIFTPIFVRNAFSQFGLKWATIIKSIVFNSIWLLLSIYVLKVLSKGRRLAQKKITQNDTNVIKLIETDKPQRLFHHIFDLIFSVLICSQFLIIAFNDWFGQLEHNIDERFALYALIVLSRLIYYIFFEVIFGATPAKFLTESQVVDANGKNINLLTGIFRSLARHVPFEAFSYLQEGNGWHDKWVNTKVVKEENSGVPAKRYLLIIVLIVVTGILGYIGHKFYEDYQRIKSYKQDYISKVENLRNTLSNLTDSIIIKVKPISESILSKEEDYYLKVEEIIGNKVLCSIFQFENSSPKNIELEKYYEEHKNQLNTVLIAKKDLIESITYDFKQHQENIKNGKELLKSGTKYEIDEIYKIYAPAISISGSSSFGGGSLSFNIKNEGWNAILTSIDNIEGNLEWNNTLPQKVNTVEKYSSSSLGLSASNVVFGKKYKFILTIQDSTGNVQKYMVEGINSKRTMKLIKE